MIDPFHYLKLTLFFFCYFYHHVIIQLWYSITQKFNWRVLLRGSPSHFLFIIFSASCDWFAYPLLLFTKFIMSADLDQSLNVHSPYYLYPGENLATTLVSQALDPTNYNSWSRSIVTTLSAKIKVGLMMVWFPSPHQPMLSSQFANNATIW